MSNPKPPPPFVAEITVVSAEGLKNPSSFFSLRRPLRFFITLSAAPAQLQYKTTVADCGLSGTNPTWGDVFCIPLDAGFFPHGCFVFLRLFSKRLLFGSALIGWCRIPAADVAQPPVGSIRRLSYRLRTRDGSRSPAIVNLAAKVESLPAAVAVAGQVVEPLRMVIGVPVSAAEFRRSR